METKTNMKKETVRGLQDLVAINLDTAAGLKAAADKLKTHTMLSQMFRDLATERDGFATELQSFVRINDEDPATEPTWKGKLHRWWLELRADLNSHQLKPVLEEAERGEDRIKECYEDVIKGTTGNPVNDVLHRQYAKVKAAHDRIRDMRNGL